MRETHELKTWHSPFQATWNGLKPYEVRYTDRDFKVRDRLVLLEYCPQEKSYSGRAIIARITYITTPGTFEMPDNVCVLGIKVTSRRNKRGDRMEDSRGISEIVESTVLSSTT